MVGWQRGFSPLLQTEYETYNPGKLIIIWWYIQKYQD